MSDLRFNLRIWCFHIQVREGEWMPRISFNNSHWPKPSGPWIERYE